jgi:subtilisin family serine protease
MRHLVPGRAAAVGCARQFVVSKRRSVALLTTLGVVLTASSVSSGASEAERYLNRELSAERLESLRLPQPRTLESVNTLSLESKVHPSLGRASGPQDVVVKLKGPSVGRMADRSRSSRMSRKLQLQVEQGEFIQRARGRANMRLVAQTQMVLNAVFVEVDASRLEELARDPMVERVVPVGNYELYLSETVPHIGAAAVQAQGIDGSGIRVAVLDSGVDYTHADLGGGGTLADYQAAIADPASRDGLFPTGRVVEGFDFVGEVWPDGDLAPDDDPIDAGGHGTHVADIIGGQLGVAPAVDLYAVKVCSAVSTACSGIAIIQGMEFAVDPNGDGDPEDAVDVINMSLGQDYGQPFDDDLSHAVEAATGLGVLTVAAAGNGGDKPYIAGTPASAPSALSVAQTQVPSAALTLITVAGVDYPAVFQTWSTPPASALAGTVQYGDGAGGNLEGCDPFAAGSLSGLVVLVDRGACNFTTKIFNIGNAGGIVGIIGLVAPGAPFVGGFADPGGPIAIPGYMISQADSTAIKGAAAAGAEASIDPDNQLPLVGQMVGSSSRGPQHESTTLIKPEIGAPGGSVSAEVGTGDGVTPFSGTSGASPMVAGAAALLLQAEPALSPPEVKARLVNVADRDIDTDPFSGPAPITRIGGGEARIDNSVGIRVAAWDHKTLQPALSFGFTDTAGRLNVMHKLVRVRNYSDKHLWLSVDSSFRFADDDDNGAVRVRTLPKLFVRKRSDAYLPVLLTIRGEALRDNAMNSGAEGANPGPLTLNEYDGYLTLSGSGVSLHLPWHVLPRKASHVVTRKVLSFGNDGLDQVSLFNHGVGTAQNDAYSLLAVSPNLPEGEAGQNSPTPDIRAVGITTVPVPAGFCSADPSFIWAFAVNTWERQQHLLPVSHQIWLDTDRDGTEDYVLLNRDFSGLATIDDGRQLAWSLNLATGAAEAFFFAEHATNTGNTGLFICGEQIGMNAEDMLATTVNMRVVAQDFFHGGPGDEIGGLSVTPLGERYFGVPEDVPGRSSGSMQVTDFGPFEGNSDELGIMLITNGDRGAGQRGGATRTSEARLLFAKDALPGVKGKQGKKD